MTLDFAPMEGITSRDLREVHAACFPGVDRYWLPFLSPAASHQLTPRQRRDLEPGPLGRDRLVPQVLTRDPEDFLWAASALGELGYREINLNLGCPSGTVVGKGKGAGMLRSPEKLDRFLEAVFSAAPLAVSVKTRIGLEAPAEWEGLLPVFARYPIRELCVHPRTRREMYRGRVHFGAFAEAAARLPFPLRYNGNLFTPAAVQRLEASCPGLSGAMLGRGLLADPALITRCKGGVRDRETLIAFHEELAARYLAAMHPDGAVLPKFKELWMYLSLLLAEERAWKRLRKCARWAEFHPLALGLLRDAELLPEAEFSRLDQSDVQFDQ
ncbi:MAG: tRNA-dihydrouridine synthase family protein [Oscillospiraceae bacterium]|nr:tRNA-dihydrouridine synthase family protein [Oscillospiraceae bacterium]